ncbi:MAG: hypothetical protein U0938_01975 [Thiobacillus sp.]|nr:hypothetical protein [Thiobacillus sp.]
MQAIEERIQLTKALDAATRRGERISFKSDRLPARDGADNVFRTRAACEIHSRTNRRIPVAHDADRRFSVSPRNGSKERLPAHPRQPPVFSICF